MKEFNRIYDKDNVPNCFPGDLDTARQVTNSFICACHELSGITNIRTDIVAPNRTRLSAIKNSITFPKSQALANYSKQERNRILF